MYVSIEIFLAALPVFIILILSVASRATFLPTIFKSICSNIPVSSKRDASSTASV